VEWKERWSDEGRELAVLAAFVQARRRDVLHALV
jgi:hypothetical protein